MAGGIHPETRCSLMEQFLSRGDFEPRSLNASTSGGASVPFLWTELPAFGKVNVDDKLDGREADVTFHLNIPESVADSIRLPLPEVEPRLRSELALALYAQNILSFGKAA